MPSISTGFLEWTPRFHKKKSRPTSFSRQILFLLSNKPTPVKSPVFLFCKVLVWGLKEKKKSPRKCFQGSKEHKMIKETNKQKGLELEFICPSHPSPPPPVCYSYNFTDALSDFSRFQDNFFLVSAEDMQNLYQNSDTMAMWVTLERFYERKGKVPSSVPHLPHCLPLPQTLPFFWPWAIFSPFL